MIEEYEGKEFEYCVPEIWSLARLFVHANTSQCDTPVHVAPRYIDKPGGKSK
jgi:hypothetical protein